MAQLPNAERVSAAEQARQDRVLATAGTTHPRLPPDQRPNPFTQPPSEEQRRKETNQRIFGTQTDAERQADQAGVRAKSAAENQRSLAEFNATRAPSTTAGAPSNKETLAKKDTVPSTGEEKEIVAEGSRFATFNINNFRSELNTYGALPTHSFLVRFAPFLGNTRLTAALTNYTTINKDKLVLRCDNAILPGVTLIKEEAIRRYGYGPTETVPYNVNFGDFTLQWIVDDNSEIIDFFNRWINLVVNHDSKGGADMSTVSGEFNDYDPYTVGYKDDYSNSKVSVFVYDRQLNTTIEYNIFDAFPISIQSVNLSWGDENQVMKYNVTFAFTDMIIKTPKSGDNALFLAAQKEAENKASVKSPNEEKTKNDMIITTNNNRPNSILLPGNPTTVGNYTISTPPVAGQTTIDVLSGKPNLKTLNMITL